jgi:hypothetical protein
VKFNFYPHNYHDDYHHHNHHHHQHNENHRCHRLFYRNHTTKPHRQDMTKLESLVIVDTKQALQSAEAQNEWSMWCYLVVGRADDFNVDADHCPLLCGLINLHMLDRQLKTRANKKDYPGNSTPVSSTKADKSVALLLTASRRAANHIREGVSSAAGPFKLFHNAEHSDMKEVRALLVKTGQNALDALLTSAESLQARHEWLACVDYAYYHVIEHHDLQALTKGDDATEGGDAEASDDPAEKGGNVEAEVMKNALKGVTIEEEDGSAVVEATA